MKQNTLFMVFDQSGNYKFYHFDCVKPKDIQKFGQDIANTNGRCEVFVEGSNTSSVFFKE
jgi:hypothetical protein